MPMDADFPAAHSMDSSWYAVDQNGNVALFITGEGGAMPEHAYSPEAAEFMEEIGDEEREELGFPPAGVLDPGELPPQERLFVYETGPLDQLLAERYRRTQVPAAPVHLDELPPAVREALARMRFDGLAFAETDVFQPIELTPCGTWDAAYMAGDGRTVRPVPGREGDYSAFYAEYRKDLERGHGMTLEEPRRGGGGG
jgi:hypothetical protein